MAFKLKFRTLFPANVTASSPLTLVKTGLRYAFGLDVDVLRESLDPIYKGNQPVLRPSDYGAVGDGAADDAVALQAWANGLSATKKPGALEGKTYRTTSTVSLGNDTYIDGTGTIVYEGTGNGLDFSGKSRIALKNFTLRGNAVAGVYTFGNRGLFAQTLSLGVGFLTINYTQDILIEGMKISGFADTLISGGWWKRAKIVDCDLGAAGFSHVTILSPSDLLVHGNNCHDLTPGSGTLGVSVLISRSASSPMCSLADSPMPSKVTVSDNSFRDMPALTAIDLHSGENITISGNVTRLVKKGINLEHHCTRGTTASTTTTTTISLGTGAIQVDGYYNGMGVMPTSGALVGVERTITAYDGASQIATVGVAWASAPQSGVTLNILEAAADSTKCRIPVVHNCAIVGNTLSGNEASSSTDYGIAVDTRSVTFAGSDDISTGIVISNNVLRHHGLPSSGGTFGTDTAAIYVGNSIGTIVTDNSFPNAYGRAICINNKATDAKVSNNVARSIATTQATNVMIEHRSGTSCSAFAESNICDSANTALFSCAVPSTSLDGLYVGAGNVSRGASAVFFSGTTRANAKGIGVPGTATNDDAGSGEVGEYISSTVALASAVTLTTGTSADITSLSLTPGDWDVEGNIEMSNTGAPTVTTLLGWVNPTSVTLPSGVGTEGGFVQWRGSTTANVGTSTGQRRFSLATTTTVYLSCQSAFTGGTNAKAYGLIRARRVR